MALYPALHTQPVPLQVECAGQVPVEHCTVKLDAPQTGAWQIPPEQVVAQVAPQFPQLAGSVSVFVHLVPQTCWPGGQAQLPNVHEAPVTHAWPHEPQFCVLVLVSTQTPPQLTSVPGHLQTPPWQLWPLLQTVVQLPQWLGSVVVSVHTPLQLVLAQVQLPFMQA
jgi:hypothetical protein